MGKKEKMMGAHASIPDHLLPAAHEHQVVSMGMDAGMQKAMYSMAPPMLVTPSSIKIRIQRQREFEEAERQRKEYEAKMEKEEELRRLLEEAEKEGEEEKGDGKKKGKKSKRGKEKKGKEDK